MSDIKSTGGKLSYMNINDQLLQGALFAEIRNAQSDQKLRGEDWGYYEIQPSDYLMPELIAYNIYGIDTLKWVVMTAAGLDDTRDGLEVGTKIYLPKTSWLRERIKYYMSLENI